MPCPRAEGRRVPWRRPRVVSLLVLSLLLPVHVTLADDALVLPQGRWYVTAEGALLCLLPDALRRMGGPKTSRRISIAS